MQASILFFFWAPQMLQEDLSRRYVKVEPSIWKSAWKGVFETEGEGKCKEGKFSTQTVCFESLMSNLLALDYLPVP